MLAASAAAADLPADAPVIAEADAAQPAAELVRLDRELTGVLEAKEQGRITRDRFEDFAVRFRTNLDAAKAAASPTTANAALCARILGRLGDFKRAGDVIGAALDENPKDLSLRVALSQVRYDEKDYPAALIAADTALALDPSNKEALALKHFSAGRVSMKGDTADNHSLSTGPSPARVFSPGRIHFVAADPATLPFQLPVRMPPSAEPPGSIAHGEAPAAPGPLPLLPLAGAAALGLAAYGVSRSRVTYESTEGLDDAHPKPVGRLQRLVAGAILAGALGGVVYTVGAALAGASPIALSYAASVGSQDENAEEAVPHAEAVADEAEQIILKKGEILNRVWHSDWKPGSALSGPEGFSYCRGACLPIHAATAIEGRGLTIGVINNGRMGGLYRVTEDVIVTVRQAVGGFEEEILFRAPDDLAKLEPIR
ncbi:MAG: tetratricopeptide repeat protein, partial [Elusimicrobiota bacterium]